MQTTSPQQADFDEQLGRLLTAARDGDVPAFESFYALTIRLLLPTVRSVCGANHCEDVLSDAYFQAWQSLPTFDPSRGGALTWIKVIARSRARDRMRAERVRNAGCDGVIEHEFEDSADPAPGPQQIVENLQEHARLKTAVTALPPKHQLLLHMAHHDDCTQSEIAGVTGLPMGTVKTVLRRSYIQLRGALAPSPA